MQKKVVCPELIGRTSEQEALAIFTVENDRRGIAETHDFLGLLHLHRADMFQASRSYAQAASLFRELGDRRRLASSLAMLITASTPNYLHDLATFPPEPKGESAIEEVLALARELGWRANEASALFRRAITAGYRGEYGQALAAAHKALAISEEIEHRQWTVENEYGLGVLTLDLLALVKAKEHLERALALARQINSILWTEIIAPPLAQVYLSEDAPEKAAALLEDVFGPEPPLHTLQQRGCWAVRAELRLAEDEPQAALAIVEQLTAFAPAGREESDGEDANAHDLCRAIPRAGYLRGRILAALGRFEEAESTLQAAIAGARQQEAQPLQWRLHVALGNLYQKEGRREDADRAFEEAVRIIRVLADTVPDEHIRSQFLQGVSARLPRKYALTGNTEKKAPGGLTPRQQEVAWHVAQGKTNKAIAEELVLSVRTVEDHVGNILAKLGFDSRTEIATWAVEQELERE